MTQGLPVHGYKDQTQDNIDMVNANKLAEEAATASDYDMLMTDPWMHHTTSVGCPLHGHTSSKDTWHSIVLSSRPARVSLPDDHTVTQLDAA